MVLTIGITTGSGNSNFICNVIYERPFTKFYVTHINLCLFMSLQLIILIIY